MAKSKTKKPAETDELTPTLEDMHVRLAKELRDRIKNGSATAADLNVARQFLKDNHIEGNLRKNKPLRDLTDILPFDDAATGTG